MSWKERLRELENAKQWDEAIEFMANVIDENPDDMDAYIAINYFFMNLITEEDYPNSKFHDYVAIAHYYFDESYEKFSDNPEYLFFTGMTMSIADWYMDIGDERIKEMLKKALALEPDNLLYLRGTYSYLDVRDPDNAKLTNACKKKILETPAIVEFLKSKGAMGQYILEVQLQPTPDNMGR